MGRKILLGLLPVCLLGAPSSASAAVTFGADLSLSPDQGCGSCAAVTLTRTGGVANTGSPAAGVLVSASIRTRDAGGLGSIRVLAPTGNTDEYFNRGEVPISVAADLTPGGHITQVPARLPVQIGDRLAASFPSINSPRFIHSDANALFAIRVEDPPGFPVHATGATALYDMHGAGTKGEALLAGTVEADADQDGFGDESQDRCPGVAGVDGGCVPPVANLPKKKRCKKGFVLKKVETKSGKKRKKCVRRKRKR